MNWNEILDTFFHDPGLINEKWEEDGIFQLVKYEFF